MLLDLKEPTKLTFEDLLSPTEKRERKLVAIKARFEAEKADATDAIVRALNAEKPLPIKIYTFRDQLDGYNEMGPMYNLWTEWLKDIRINQYPHLTLPRLMIKIPYYNNNGVAEKPYIWIAQECNNVQVQ